MKKKAIVLLNMGGPNNLSEVEVFLKNMFADYNVLRIKNKFIRTLVGRTITLLRTKKSQQMYEKIGGKSPIVEHTKKLVSVLETLIMDPDLIVEFAMRYTPPFADTVAQHLKDLGVTHVYLIPLYPQYSSSTTYSSIEDFAQSVKNIGWNDITIDSIENFYTDELYNSVVLERIIETLQNSDPKNYDLVFSAHGLPKKLDAEDGGIYERHVNEHVRLLVDKLKNSQIYFNDIHLAYQSKLGPMEWLTPSLETTLKSLKNKRVIIFPIAFTIDNSETDYELSIEYAEVANELGFEDYKVCKCPNDHPLFAKALFQMYQNMSMK